MLIFLSDYASRLNSSSSYCGYMDYDMSEEKESGNSSQRPTKKQVPPWQYFYLVEFSLYLVYQYIKMSLLSFQPLYINLTDWYLLCQQFEGCSFSQHHPDLYRDLLSLIQQLIEHYVSYHLPSLYIHESDREYVLSIIQHVKVNKRDYKCFMATTYEEETGPIVDPGSSENSSIKSSFYQEMNEGYDSTVRKRSMDESKAYGSKRRAESEHRSSMSSIILDDESEDEYSYGSSMKKEEDIHTQSAYSERESISDTVSRSQRESKTVASNSSYNMYLPIQSSPFSIYQSAVFRPFIVPQESIQFSLSKCDEYIILSSIYKRISTAIYEFEYKYSNLQSSSCHDISCFWCQIQPISSSLESFINRLTSM